MSTTSTTSLEEDPCFVEGCRSFRFASRRLTCENCLPGQESHIYCCRSCWLDEQRLLQCPACRNPFPRQPAPDVGLKSLESLSYAGLKSLESWTHIMSDLEVSWEAIPEEPAMTEEIKYCDWCNSESRQGRMDGAKWYCDSCWDCWEGKLPAEVEEAVNKMQPPFVRIFHSAPPRKVDPDPTFHTILEISGEVSLHAARRLDPNCCVLGMWTGR